MSSFRTIQVDGSNVFYREGGDEAAPAPALLHRFPSSSAQHQSLMKRLEDRYYAIPPDDRRNAKLYPRRRGYMRVNRPPALLVWSQSDLLFPPYGAQPYLDDRPRAELHLLDTGHFATATPTEEISELVTAFLDDRSRVF
jgi:pimeloyl-ACP methyl ester carboxylesterase